MGLDSVELIIAFEKYFNIIIKNEDAETIGTIQDATDVIARYINVETEQPNLSNEIFDKIQSVIFQENKVTIAPSDLVSKYLSKEDSKTWERLSTLTGLIIPLPNGKLNEKQGFLNRLFTDGFLWKPLHKWSELNFASFTDVICAANINTLIDPKNIRNKYEVYIAVMVITASNIGVELFEISPEKSFTDDLGID